MDKMLYVIVVFYKPTVAQIERVQSLAQYYNVIVVNNTPNADARLLSINVMSHIVIGENVGIAMAQNIGIHEVKKYGGEYILFLDQDSEIPISFPMQMLKEYLNVQKIDAKIVALGPLICNIETHAPYKTYGNIKSIGDGCFVCPTLISSGTLSPLSAFERIGMMDERLFIDFVDHEWCWRAAKRGFICCMTMKINMEHKVGQKEFSFLGFPFLLATPFRYYYQYRNSYWLLKRSYVPWSWKMKTLIRNFIGFIYIPCVSDEPFAVIKYMIKGMCSGIFNSTINHSI